MSPTISDSSHNFLHAKHGSFFHPDKNGNRYPTFGIENKVTNQREFTVTLPTNKTYPYLYTDVVYDVHGKSLISLFFNACYFRSDNTGNLVASISKWWTLPFSESSKPNICVACCECICKPIGRFQILFRESVKFSNYGKVLWPSYFASKVDPSL